MISTHSVTSTATMPMALAIAAKTRSGKIMRRILRKVATGMAEELGDTSTLADLSILDILIQGSRALHKK